MRDEAKFVGCVHRDRCLRQRLVDIAGVVERERWFGEQLVELLRKRSRALRGK
jgi:hypothetical protein